MSDVRRVFPARLKRLRQAAGVGQAQLAERVGVSTEFVSRMERGKTLPSLVTLGKLCDALGCSPNELLLPSRREDMIESLYDRLHAARPGAAREATRVAEAVLEYHARRRE